MTPSSPGKPLTQQEREEMAQKFKNLIEKFDKELRAKGLSDADREALLQELLQEDGKA